MTSNKYIHFHIRKLISFISTKGTFRLYHSSCLNYKKLLSNQVDGEINLSFFAKLDVSEYFCFKEVKAYIKYR